MNLIELRNQLDDAGFKTTVSEENRLVVEDMYPVRLILTLSDGQLVFNPGVQIRWIPYQVAGLVVFCAVWAIFFRKFSSGIIGLSIGWTLLLFVIRERQKGLERDVRLALEQAG